MKLSIRITLLQVFFSSLIFAQNKSQPHDSIIPPQTPSNIDILLKNRTSNLNVFAESQSWTSTKTSKHEKVRGTGVFMIPPLGVSASKDISGFTSDNINIYVIESIGLIEKQLDFFKKGELEKKDFLL